MRRYIRSFRTRKNIRSSNALETQFIRQLQKEADRLLKEFTDKFTAEAQGSASQILQSMFSTVPGSGASGKGVDPSTTSDLASISGVGQLLSTGVRYLISRPRTSSNTVESSRSIDVEAQFRISRAQAFAEAQAAMNRGDKNA